MSEAASRLNLHDGSAVSRAAACSDGFGRFDGGPECGVYIQICSVEQVRIGAAFRGAAHACVALVGAGCRRGSRASLTLWSAACSSRARAPRAFLRGGGDQILTSGVRKMTVPMSRPRAPRQRARRIPLEGARRPHLGNARDQRGGFAAAWALRVFFIETGGGGDRATARPRLRRPVVEPKAAIDHRLGDRPVEQRYRDAAARSGLQPLASVPFRRPPARRWR